MSVPTKRLAELCEIKPPKSEARKRLGPDAPVSFAPMEDLSVDQKYLPPRSTRRLDEVAGSYTYFADGDVLLAKITPCFENGKLGIARNLENGVGFGSSEFVVLRPSAELNAEFLYYFLAQATIREQGAAAMTGAVGHKRIPKEFIEELRVPTLPLTEQQRIVAILDEAYAGIATARAAAEQNRQNARALFESHLHSVFSQRGKGWVEKRIEEWCFSIIDCVNKTAPVVDYETPYKMIRTTNVRNGRIDLSSVKFVTEETFKIWIRRQLPQKGDVILTREAPMGEVGMLRTDDHVFLGQRLVSYRTNPEILDNEFLLFALQSGYLQEQIHAKASGSTVQHMRVPDTKNLLLAAPPVGEQVIIVQHLKGMLEETQRLEALYQHKLKALDELKQSMLHQAFSGQL